MTPLDFIKENQNNVILNEYSLTDMIWFMDKYSEYVSIIKYKNQVMWFENFRTKILKDTIKECEYHRHKGCAHVDGFLCDVDSCDILNEYRESLDRLKKINKIKTKINEKVCIRSSNRRRLRRILGRIKRT